MHVLTCQESGDVRGGHCETTLCGGMVMRGGVLAGTRIPDRRRLKMCALRSSRGRPCPPAEREVKKLPFLPDENHRQEREGGQIEEMAIKRPTSRTEPPGAASHPPSQEGRSPRTALGRVRDDIEAASTQTARDYERYALGGDERSER